MKNNAQHYIISQESNIAEGRVQLFLEENFGVNNYLLCSASYITYQNKQYFTGIGFLAYAKPNPTIYEILYPITEIVPIQLLAYYTALEKKTNPDYPRNLAKSVTVK